MKNPLPFLLFIISFFCSAEAQTPHQNANCGTPPEKSEWLTRFQQHIGAYEKSSEILYVPITLHFVGTNDGEGYYPLQDALDEVCQLNQTFEPAEIQFFLDEVNYINNTDWYQGIQFTSMMIANNQANTINCYIVHRLPGFSGMYSSTGDAVIMSRQGFYSWDPLFAHELGHYFSLYHTFRGWEGQQWDYSTPAPNFIGGRKVERVDGEDCAFAGDGFCDTAPDYLGLGNGYLCDANDESFIVQTDPVGATFRTDCSLVMSYSQNPHRFSYMQISAMRANIEQVRPSLLDNQDPLPDISGGGVTLTSPAQGATVSPDEPLTLEWEPLANATHYIVDITFLPVLSSVYDQYVVEGNSLIIDNLLSGKAYRWRVRPYNAFHTCAGYSEESTFSTGELVACGRSVTIGQTVYDFQTNGSVCNRISTDTAGNIMATWTMSLNSANGYADRGAGYNRYEAATGSWGEIPTQRLEPIKRTGWPNHVITDTGTELIVTHEFTSQGIFLRTLRKEAGAQNWVGGEVPVNTPRGAFVARMACAGETVHLIALTPTLNFGGVVYQGVNGHILYYRSSDGGLNWDITDAVIPGLDNSFMVDAGLVDYYALDARDNVVAVGVFSQINDVRIFISEDGGDTWTHTRIHDFPIDMYQIGQGYSLSDLPPPAPDQPGPFAMASTDNSGSVLVDRNGLVHTFYGRMYVQDHQSDDFFIRYLDTDGLAYWNETFGADSTRIITQTVDLNGNNTIDIEGNIHLTSYLFAMTSQPSPAVDEDNNLYLAYTGVMEGPDYRKNDRFLQYRHIWLIHSEDGGESWSAPFDAITAACPEDPEGNRHTEAIFPSMVRDISTDVQFIYQQDYSPGNSAGAFYPEEMNFINFIRIPISELGVVKSGEVVKPESFRMELYPNPALGTVTLAFELEDPAFVELQLLSVMGQWMRPGQSQKLSAGAHRFGIDVADLPAGLYLVKLQSENKIAISRLVVE